MIGITGYGAYLPRLRMRRQAIAEANAWYAPNIRGKGTRTLANWDEDVVTMAVAAARDCLGRGDDRGNIAALMLASTTLPFAERLNGAIVARALTLDRSVAASDVGGHRELIADGRPGVLFAPDDPAACAHALADLIDRRESWDTMRDAGRAHVAARHNWARNVENYRAVYQRLVGDPPENGARRAA